MYLTNSQFKFYCLTVSVCVLVKFNHSFLTRNLQTLMSVFLECMAASSCVSTQWDPSLVAVLEDLSLRLMAGIAWVSLCVYNNV